MSDDEFKCTCAFCTTVQPEPFTGLELLKAEQLLLGLSSQKTFLWSMLHTAEVRQQKPYVITQALEKILNSGARQVTKEGRSVFIAPRSGEREGTLGGSPGGERAKPVRGAAPPCPGYGAEPHRGHAARRDRAIAKTAQFLEYTFEEMAAHPTVTPLALVRGLTKATLRIKGGRRREEIESEPEEEEDDDDDEEEDEEE